MNKTTASLVLIVIVFVFAAVAVLIGFASELGTVAPALEGHVEPGSPIARAVAPRPTPVNKALVVIPGFALLALAQVFFIVLRRAAR